VRRASALQLTRDAKRANQAGLGEALFIQLELKEGDLLNITQGSTSITLPATLEAGLAPNTIRISAGTIASAKLGPMFGSVTVTKA